MTLAAGPIVKVKLTLPRKLARTVRKATVVVTAPNAAGQGAPPRRFKVKFGG